LGYIKKFAPESVGTPGPERQRDERKQ